MVVSESPWRRGQNEGDLGNHARVDGDDDDDNGVENNNKKQAAERR